MSQLAALYVTAHQAAEDATTYGAKQYFMGVRDAFQASFLACHGISSDTEPLAAATFILAELDAEERRTLMVACSAVIFTARSAVVSQTLAAV